MDQDYGLWAKTVSLPSTVTFKIHKPLNSNYMDSEKMIKAYCLKTKEKNVPMQDAVISKTAKGGYMASGHDGKGNKMAAILSESKALQAIQDGVATKNF